MRVALLGLLLLPFAAGAGEIVESSVGLDSGVYTIDVLVRIEAPLEVVYRAITDYDHLTEINPSILESRVVAREGAGRSRVYTRIRVCILFFCKQVHQVQDMVEYGNAHVRATIVPESSDFESGQASWDLVVADDVTYMQFSTSFDPSFWVPPVIGKWLIKREMNRQVLGTAVYIERHAGSQAWK